MDMESCKFVGSQELEAPSLYHLYSLKAKNSQCHYVVMTRSATKLSAAILTQDSGQTRYLRISWHCGFSNDNRLIACKIRNTSDKTIKNKFNANVS